MTICRKCQGEFEMSDADRRRCDYRCPVCKNAYNLAWRQANPEKYAALVKRQSRSTKDYRHEYDRRKADPVLRKKMRVRRVLRNAVQAGKIQRQPCEVCGSPKVDGHHDDYSQPLNVRWLCRPHHAAVHHQEL